MITITLLAFLVLLLVSLASLTRVETQVASNTQQLGQARQNALMALNIALGELQRLTGPDRRVTATANLGRGPGGAALTTQPGTSFWTGVWGDSAKTTASVPAPILLGWLVSGNEGATVSQDSVAQDFGRITSADATQAFTPDLPVPTLTTTSTALSTDLTINSKPAVLLAGRNSIGTNAATDLPGYVVAPLVPITAAAGTVPGLGAAATPPVGGYAWWVGDEGVKARVNLVDALAPRPASTDGAVAAFTPTLSQQQLRLQAAQRMGGEAIGSTDASGASVLLSALGNVTANTVAGADAQERLARTLAADQLPMFDPTLASVSVARRFNDITTYSAGVLSDTARGGLRGDLTQLFSATTDSAFRTNLQTYWNNDLSTAASRTLTAGVPVADDLNRDGVFSDPWANGPTWEQVWSFYNMGNLPTATPVGVMTSGAATPRGQTALQHGIGPVLVQARLYWGNTVKSVGGGNNAVDVLLRPAFVLANPYSVPLAASTYTVTVDLGAGMAVGWWVAGDTTYRWSSNGSFRLNNLKFQIQCPQLAPGEARIMTLKYAQPGWNATDFNYTWSASGTYVFENDWDAGLANIVIPATATITDADLAKGVKMAFGMYSNTGDPSPATRQGFGNFSITLWGPDGLRLQRVENFGYGGLDYSGQNTIATTVSARNWQGGITVRRRGVSNPDNPYDNIVQGINWRAPLMGRDSSTQSPPPVWGISHFTSNNWFAGEMLLESGSTPLKVYWGKTMEGTTSFRNTLSGGELLNDVAFDVPAATGPLVSLGQLQHFNAGGNMDGYTQTLGSAPSGTATAVMLGLAATPAYAIGNGRASPYIDRNALSSSISGRTIYDASWLLNRTLWDRYFFSSVPQGSATFDFATDLLSNPRLKPFRSTLASNAVASYRATANSAATNLLNIGAFNVNSTSVEAWKALFSSLNGVPYPGSATGLTGAFARSVRQTGGYASAGDGISSDAWTGYRNLSTTEIGNLATAMVAQVKLRGPFVSLADFVNRRLLASVADPNSLGIEGALGTAIQNAGLNAVAGDKINNAPYSNTPGSNPPSNLTGGNTTLMPNGNTAHLLPARVAGVPGWITQADLLQALGPTLSARSDTFIIRTYGEVKNPVTQATTGRAWLEAVVQRLPDYVDPTNTPEKRATDLTANNQTFGRKFQIVSYRWLTPNDI